MEAPVKAAIIAATAATIIAAAQITSQWMLALRAEKKSSPKEKPDIQSMNSVIRKKFLSVGLLVSVVLQVFLIGFMAFNLRGRAVSAFDVVLISFQICVLFSALLFSFLSAAYVVSLRYVLTGSLEKEEANQVPEPTAPSGRGSS